MFKRVVLRLLLQRFIVIKKNLESKERRIRGEMQIFVRVRDAHGAKQLRLEGWVEVVSSRHNWRLLSQEASFLPSSPPSR